MPPVHYQSALQCLCSRVYHLRFRHPDKDIMIYKDDLVLSFRRLCCHPYFAAAYNFVLSAYLVIPVGMVFGFRYSPSLFCFLSKMRSFASQFVHHLPLSWPTALMIYWFRFPHAPPSAEQKLLGRETDDQVDEESSAPESILFIQGWLVNFARMTVGNWQAQVKKLGNMLTNFLFSLSFQICRWQKIKGEKSKPHFPPTMHQISLQPYN